MERKKLVTGMVLMALAAVSIEEAVRLPFGTLRTPQSGFWPLILGILLAFFSLIHLGNTVREKAGKRTPFWAEPGAWKKICLVVGFLVAFGFLFEPLGYLLSVFLLIGFLLRVIKPMRWWLVLAVAFLSSALSYVIFGGLLSTPLPSGLLGL